jgi:quinol monooxygenase YgiN
MPSQKLTVVAKIRAKSGLKDKVKAELLNLISPTRKESGCINYDLHQSQEDENLFLFYENWISRQDLDDHLKTPHLQAFLGKSEELLAEPIEITFWNMISQPAG